MPFCSPAIVDSLQPEKLQIYKRVHLIPDISDSGVFVGFLIALSPVFFLGFVTAVVISISSLHYDLFVAL